jgi:hypothetical protein
MPRRPIDAAQAADANGAQSGGGDEGRTEKPRAEALCLGPDLAGSARVPACAGARGNRC